MHTAWKKFITVLCLVALLCSMLPTVYAGGPAAEYRIKGSMLDSKTLQVSIFVYGVTVLGGRFALGFDPTKLEIPTTTNYISDTVTPSGTIRYLSEGKEVSELISQEKGHVMFAWYPYGEMIDATTTECMIGTIRFKLKSGVTETDFDSRTLYMYSVGTGYLGWKTSAWVRDEHMTDYSNCVAGHEDIGIIFDYPNCDAEVTDVRNVYIDTRDWADSPIPFGTARIEGLLVNADDYGRAKFRLAPGLYTTLVTAPGYEDKVAAVEVGSGDIYRIVRLRSLQALVDYIAEDLEIGFQGEDTAKNVTRDMIFPVVGAQNTIIYWVSSDRAVVSNYGDVFRQAEPTDVTVTATVVKDDKIASKSFTLHITAKEEAPTPLPEDPPEYVIPGSAMEFGGSKDIPLEDPTAEKYFQDLSSVPWAEEAIEAMHELGIIHGTAEHQYSPEGNITRADFLCLIMRMFDPKGELGEGFDDVKEGSYYHDAVVQAQGLGIAKGDHGKFDPKGRITRQDMIVSTYRLLQLFGKAPTGGEYLFDSFPDKDETSSYAKEAVSAMLTSGYIKGKGDMLAPKANTTRAEAAVFLYRLYQDLLEVT